VAYSFLRGQRLLKPPTLVVASKDYTEQLILGEMAALVLIDAGYQVVDKVGMGGSKVVRDAMMAGEVDIYVELTGSALAVHNSLPGEALPTDPDRAHLLAKSLDAPRGIVWLARGPFNDTYSIMVREDLWNQGIQSLQDLADFMNANDSPLSICVENDFFGRAHDGLPAVEERYGFTFKPENIQLMELDQIYTAFRAGECDVAEGYSTDGRGVAWGFFNLADPEAVFPFYNPAAVVRQAVLSSNPELEGLLDGFVTLLDDATMSQLNARVDIGADGEVDSGDEETPEAVARDFLLDAGLIDPAGPAATPSTEAEGDAETPGEPSAQTESEPAATPAPASEEPAPESQVEAGSPITTTPPVTETVPLTATAEAAATTAPTVTEEAASTAEPPISEEPTATDEMTATETVTATDEATATGVLSPAGALVAQAPPTAVVVASADTPADLLLGQLYLQLLQEAGLPVVDRTALGSPPAVRAALEQGEIDLYPERTGRALAQIHGLPASVWPTDPGRSYALAQSLDQPQGFLWLNRGFFHGGLALLVPQALAGQGVETISDLAEHAGEETIPFKLCLDSALSAELLAELTAQYGFNLASEDLVQVPDGETYAGLRNGLCDMAVGQPIDGRVTAWQLSTLIDNRAVFPSDAPAPVIRQSVAAAFPEVAIVLASLDNVLDNATMSRATALFTLGPDGEAETGDEAPIADVARVLLCDANLLANCADAQSYTPEAPQAAEEAVFSETVISGAVVSETLIVAAAGQIVVRTPASNAVNARAQPNAQAEVVELVAASSALPAIGRTPDYLWLQILLPDGRTAWVFTSAVFSQSNEINGLPVVEG
jgi:glycine betaine/choline ABC-type transport system substrate-binding protein